MLPLLNEEFDVGGEEGVVVGDVAGWYVAFAGQRESSGELSRCRIYGGGCGGVKGLKGILHSAGEGRPISLLVVDRGV